jgi:hypothetical protein
MREFDTCHRAALHEGRQRQNLRRSQFSHAQIILGSATIVGYRSSARPQTTIKALHREQMRFRRQSSVTELADSTAIREDRSFGPGRT